MSGLARALTEAIAAAREAGALLLDEYHRPGGPRGDSEKAPADAEAEVAIARRLNAAFPDWGFLGEECADLVRPPLDPERHCWVVDPNDGTSAFHKGLRGSAVSIGLLRRNEPVLGVVFAYNFPDDEGVLFAFAEGQGDVQVNGAPLRRTPWPEVLERRHTVLLSYYADGRPLPNGSLVRPARYRALPSIAHRLALAAAGHAAAAVSVGPVRGIDYAAGHALLRGAGAELFDDTGDIVRYAEAGESRADVCAGGHPGVARRLAMLPWKSEIKRHPRLEVDAIWTSPSRTRSRPRPGLLRRAQGALLGQIVGDSLGSLVEFRDAGSIRKMHPSGLRALDDGGPFDLVAGQPTDDSELALALGRSIARSRRYDEEDAAAAYVRWLDSEPFDVGATIGRALDAGVAARRRGEDGLAAKLRQAATRESQANGALMRCVPIGIAGHSWSNEELVDAARRDASLTHPHAVCRDANAVFTIAVASALRSGASGPEVYDMTARAIEGLDLDADLRASFDAARASPPVTTEHIGWVRIAFQNAFHRLITAASFEEGVVETVMSGGDTDTNAAIAGALLGAVFGRDAIPVEWCDRVLTCRPLAGLDGIMRPRPYEFWPIDTLRLAERLVDPS